MNKDVILTLMLTFVSNCIMCQSIPNWQIATSWGIEEHEKRLFDYSEKESLLEMQPERWGTYHFGVNLKKKIWNDQKLSGFVGLGLGYEKATFLRPFDHICFEKDYDEILRNLNKYEKIQLPLIFSTFYEFGNHLFLSGELVSNILLYRSIDHTENNSGAFPYTESTFELDEVHFVLGINYQIGRFYAGINSRVLNYQKIDKIIFNYIIKDPRTDQKWEWNNPLRFGITIGCMW